MSAKPLAEHWDNSSFIAQYRGVCLDCEEAIVPGMRIQKAWDGESYRHLHCPSELNDGEHAEARPVCHKCFLELPVSGICGSCPED